MRSFAFGIVAVLLIAPLACNPFDPNRLVILEVTDIQAPATIPPATPLTVVLAVTTGGCRSFDRIDVQRAAGAAVMTAVGPDARRKNGDAVCSAAVVSEPHSYTFDPPIDSPFSIRVVRPLQAPLSITVTVQ